MSISRGPTACNGLLAPYFRRTSARNRAAFNADPDRFTPQFGGYCAMGMSRGKKFDADPTVFRIVDGKLYVFSSPKAGDAADQDSELLARARQAWESLK